MKKNMKLENIGTIKRERYSLFNMEICLLDYTCNFIEKIKGGNTFICDRLKRQTIIMEKRNNGLSFCAVKT